MPLCTLWSDVFCKDLKRVPSGIYLLTGSVIVDKSLIIFSICISTHTIKIAPSTINEDSLKFGMEDFLDMKGAIAFMNPTRQFYLLFYLELEDGKSS